MTPDTRGQGTMVLGQKGDKGAKGGKKGTCRGQVFNRIEMGLCLVVNRNGI